MTSDSSTIFKATTGKYCCSDTSIVEKKKNSKENISLQFTKFPRRYHTHTHTHAHTQIYIYTYTYGRSRWNEGMYKRRGLFVSCWLCVPTSSVPWHGMAGHNSHWLLISNTRIKASRQQWKDRNGDHTVSEIWMKMLRIMLPLALMYSNSHSAAKVTLTWGKNILVIKAEYNTKCYSSRCF